MEQIKIEIIMLTDCARLFHDLSGKQTGLE